MDKIEFSREEILERVTSILSTLFFGQWQKKRKDVLHITMKTDIVTDLGMDSVESLDFMTALEEEFGVDPDQFEANRKRTIGEIVDYVIDLLRQKKLKKPSQNG